MRQTPFLLPPQYLLICLVVPSKVSFNIYLQSEEIKGVEKNLYQRLSYFHYYSKGVKSSELSS